MINTTEVLEEVKMYLPDENEFTDKQMLIMINKIITAVGDDDSYYEEVTCKSAKVIAENNANKMSLQQNYKSTRVDNLWEEYFKSDNSNVWDNFLSRIRSVCTNIGYTGLNSHTSGYMAVNTSKSTSVLDDPTLDVNPTSSANLKYPL